MTQPPQRTKFKTAFQVEEVRGLFAPHAQIFQYIGYALILGMGWVCGTVLFGLIQAHFAYKYNLSLPVVLGGTQLLGLFFVGISATLIFWKKREKEAKYVTGAFGFSAVCISVGTSVQGKWASENVPESWRTFSLEVQMYGGGLLIITLILLSIWGMFALNDLYKSSGSERNVSNL